MQFDTKSKISKFYVSVKKMVINTILVSLIKGKKGRGKNFNYKSNYWFNLNKIFSNVKVDSYKTLRYSLNNSKNRMVSKM